MCSKSLIVKPISIFFLQNVIVEAVEERKLSIL